MRFVDDVFERFAARFCGEVIGQTRIAYPDHLHQDGLDYSLVSLQHVDEYLSWLHHARPETMGPEWVEAILWAGAYVGEVIRRHGPRPYRWVDFDDWLAHHPEHGDPPEPQAAEACAVLTPGDGSFTLPLDKVMRLILDGPQDSVWLYATCECRSSSR